MKKPQFALVAGYLLLVSIIGIIPAQAQNTWIAYLYNDFDRQLVRVTQNGGQNTFQLTIPEEAYVSGWDMSFSDDGGLAGYCSSIFLEGSLFSQTTFIVHDINANADRFQLDLGQTVGCATFNESFSPAGNLVAVSTVNFFADSPPADANIPFWQLRLIDTATGNIAYQLSPASPSVTTTDLTANGPLMAEVRYFDDDEIIFTETLWNTFDTTEIRAYRWNYVTDTLERIPYWGNEGVDYLTTTDELVWTTNDPSRPAGNPGVGTAGNNVVQISDSTGEARTIFTSSEFVILHTVFINNGTQLAILLLPSFDPNNVSAEITLSWMALNRDGTITPLQEGITSGDVVSAPDGYAFFEVAYSGADFADANLSLTYYRAGQRSVLWESNQDGWQLVWASPVATGADLQPFPSIQ